MSRTTEIEAAPAEPQSPARTSWPAVISLMVLTFVLDTAEFLPPALLPAMAASLGVSEGLAGQAVTATALIGFVIAPTVGLLFPRLDRRTLMTALAVAGVVSNVIVAVAPSLWVLLLGRLLTGAAIGGFWGMSLAVTARVAAPGQLGRALAVVFSGSTTATVAAVPIGAYLGAIWDWRVVFGVLAVITLAGTVVLRAVLPPIPPAPSTGLRTLADTSRVPGIAAGLGGLVLIGLGHFAGFTYVRPILDQVDGLGASGAALLLALFGTGGFLGNLLIGMIADARSQQLRYLVPAVLGTAVASLLLLPVAPQLVYVAVPVWGFAFGAVVIVVGAWAPRLAPDKIEPIGGLTVAGMQLATALGAVTGGLFIDLGGMTATLVSAAIIIAVGTLLLGSAREPE
ncbi:Predicted arabinose efflux permease, MFS family [Saccharopolyspora antimicrobica]|uniref:MFS family arabinose efflux permease n=1 Tax=Saccharopolyspora antimicrobica TaxID=455193 RepID=A0A1I4XDQ8_9PSEU|nr:MFS transporter [Saccharopolyspora antimicrobica]RKT84449.1 putative MFS family arabinose efflux permease [Saccharopolyspora antimicrobica]SFN23656.1 Predicted arabinose efflux permease, MFS family [Saccharopolyspora antimicrobica]